jgi:hypothetical protein
MTQLLADQHDSDVRREAIARQRTKDVRRQARCRSERERRLALRAVRAFRPAN